MEIDIELQPPDIALLLLDSYITQQENEKLINVNKEQYRKADKNHHAIYVLRQLRRDIIKKL